MATSKRAGQGQRYTLQCAQGCGKYTEKTARGHRALFGHTLTPIKASAVRGTR